MIDKSFKYPEEMKTRQTDPARSICPVCFRRLEAERVLSNGNMYLLKTCPEHGEFRTVIWRGLPFYDEWNVENQCTPPKTVLKQSVDGCPYDCGVCSSHQQQACCVLLEVTNACNQSCSYCFAESGKEEEEPSCGDIISWLQYLRNISEDRPFNIQLSGGEPTVRDDLPEIIRAARRIGFPYVQLNTNGLRLAEDPGYADQLKDAGLSSVFLQFDGTDDAVYRRIRGKALFGSRAQTIENCAKTGLGTVLVCTLVPGVNTEEIGKIIDYAVSNLPTVRGVHFQPVSYFGRHPGTPDNADRITLPEVMQGIELQTGGRIRAENLGALRTGSRLCSFRGSFFLSDENKIIPLSAGNGCCSCGSDNESIIRTRDFVLNKWVIKPETEKKQSDDYDFSSFDAYISRMQNYGFSITCMAFQDAWNIDLDRLEKCSVHVFDGKKKNLIPFCAYNLTSPEGKCLYGRG